MRPKLADEWRAMLGGSANEIHERWLDVLGNPTLSGYDGELSNDAFAEKKVLLGDSHLEMNRWIAARNNWTEAKLRERTTSSSARPG